MNIYEVHPTCEGGNSAGKHWFRNKKDASQFAREHLDENPDEEAPIRRHYVPATKAELVRWLNQYCGYPENG